MIKKFSFLLIGALCLSLSIKAQSKSATGQAANKSKMSLFFEKVYIHTDRELFFAGEDIWFKAYLINAQNGHLTNNSSNLYVELISSNGDVVDREVVRMDAGTGNGDFKLNDSIVDGSYQLRAYTKWMLNFGNKFIYTKTVKIHSPKKDKTAPLLDKSEAKSMISFMPEGGSLLDSVESVIAFKAIDKTGKGCSVSGVIVNSKNDTLNFVESQFNGMGMFKLMPFKNEKYTFTGKISGELTKVELPTVFETGYVLSVQQADTLVIARIYTNRATIIEKAGQKMILGGQSYGKGLVQVPFALSRLRTSIPIPKSNFPTGIARITLYETTPKLRPYCERLIFVESKDKYNVSILTNRTNYSPRDSVKMTIRVTDSKNLPVKANLSLSVTDGDIVPKSESSIASYFYLESEIRTKIENPATYFDPQNAKRAYMLDILLLSQGWRDFLWKQLADSAQKVKYLMEHGFNVYGSVTEGLTNKPVAASNVNLSIIGAKKNGLQFMLTDSMGKFYFDEPGVEFYGSKQLKLSSKKVSKFSGFLTNKGIVKLDSLWILPPSISFKAETEVTPNTKFNDEADKKMEIIRKYKLSDTILLNEMTVKSTFVSDQQLGSHIAEAGIADLDLKIGPDDYSFPDIGFFLLDKIPQAEMLAPSESAGFSRIVIRSVVGTKIAPRFSLNGKSIIGTDTALMEEEVYGLSMDQIDRVLISKHDLNQGNMERWVVSIYTKPGALDKGDPAIVKATVRGYYESRVFYSPNYNLMKSGKKDLRTTIYWNPTIITNENGEAIVSFFNADKTTQIQAVAEGVSNNGGYLNGSSKYIVK